jgi:ATP-binding cassette subfamily G (WHITE) protein 2 (PDR)
MSQGVSGAGKTTLLDVLANRTTTGVIGGNMLVDGRLRDESFQRQTGYCMQQDLHLDTSTVREALEFSALLRQPPGYNRDERLAYVDHVIRLLDMEPYVDAVVGVPGSGLNVERTFFAFSYTLCSIADRDRTQAPHYRRRARCSSKAAPLSRRAYLRS